MPDRAAQAEAVKAAKRKKEQQESRADEARKKLGVIDPFSPSWPVYKPAPIKRA